MVKVMVSLKHPQHRPGLKATFSCRVTVHQKRDKVTTMDKFPEYKRKTCID